MSRGGVFFPLSAALGFVAIVAAFHAVVAPHSMVALVARAADAAAFGASPFSMIGVFALTLALHAGLPARSVEGYVCDADNVPRVYRLNGVLVLAVVMALFACLPAAAQSGLYVNYWESLFVAFWFGIGVSTFFFTRGGVEKYARCVTKDQLQAEADDGKRPRALRSGGSGAATLASAHTPSAPVRFFLGHEWNPAFCGIDVKMWLYLAGAVGLACNILACAAAQRAAWGGEWSRALLVYCACFAWFLVEYLIGEEVHLYTYDLFAEKLGFKLAWGCLVFYPYFYGIGAFPLVHVTRERDLSAAAAAATVALFLVGWVATRGANLQKFFYRTQPQRTHFLCIAQRTVPGSRILVSGFWGLSRHLNYFGEILQAVALTLPSLLTAAPAASWSAFAVQYAPILYPLYYVALFVPRQFDDDEVCRQKYGAAWTQYVERVPWRIVPGVW